MHKGMDFIRLAATRIGEKYVYGCDVDLDDPDWHGPWDCAEFVTWVVKQITGMTFGVTIDYNPWTGAWLSDMRCGKVQKIDVYRACKVSGAILLRRHDGRGHIVFSDGKGGTIEAKGTNWGVCRDVSNPDERDFDYGILIPGVQYEGV